MVRCFHSSAISRPGFLVLRVRGSTRDGQVVRLQSPKCTIGSGANCTLRLRADNVGPVHCLILRGPSRTVVRRWSPDTRLNGRNFTESVLQAGDCLSIGAIDLEVVETAQRACPARTCATSSKRSTSSWPQIEARLRSLDEQQAELQYSNALLDDERQAWETERYQAEIAHTAKAEQLAALQAEFERQKLAFDQQQAAS